MDSIIPTVTDTCTERMVYADNTYTALVSIHNSTLPVITVYSPGTPVIETCYDLTSKLVDDTIWTEIQQISNLLSMMTPMDLGESIDLEIALHDRHIHNRYYSMSKLNASSMLGFKRELLLLSTTNVLQNIAAEPPLLKTLNLVLFTIKAAEYAPGFIRISDELRMITTAIWNNIPLNMQINPVRNVDNCSDDISENPSISGRYEAMSEDEEGSDDPDYCTDTSEESEDHTSEDDHNASSDDSNSNDEAVIYA